MENDTEYINMDLLNNIRDESEALPKEEERQHFTIDNLEKCNWVFRKLQALHNQKQEYIDLAEKEINRIDTWLERETKNITSNEEFFNAIITEYAARERKQNPKFKVSTPFGKVSFRKQQPKWDIDEDKVMEYLKTYKLNTYIRTKEEVDKSFLKQSAYIVNNQVVLPDTGETLEGITIEDQPEKIYIEVLE